MFILIESLPSRFAQAIWPYSSYRTRLTHKSFRYTFSSQKDPCSPNLHPLFNYKSTPDKRLISNTPFAESSLKWLVLWLYLDFPAEDKTKISLSQEGRLSFSFTNNTAVKASLCAPTACVISLFWRSLQTVTTLLQTAPNPSSGMLSTSQSLSKDLFLMLAHMQIHWITDL